MRRKIADVAYVKVLPEDEGKGLVDAVVAVFGNIDAVGDRIKQGAFTKSLERWKSSGDPIPCIYSHDWKNPEANCGEVVDAMELAPGDSRLPSHLKSLGGLLTRIQFDMESKYASDLFQKIRKRRIKNWSFAYDVVDEQMTKDANDLIELDIIEIGPTLVGANRETDTVAAKTEEKAAVGPHSTATTDAAWDGSKMWSNLPSPLPVAKARAACAWIDESMVSDGEVPKQSGAKFIHHMVDAEGNVGAANVTACVTGIGVLNGGRAGTTIPGADRAGVHRHLAKHMMDAGMEPPTLKEIEEMDEKALQEFLTKAGRVLSGKNEGDIRKAVELLQGVLAAVEGGSTDAGKADGEADGAMTADGTGEKADGEADGAMTPLHVRLRLLKAETA